jgi:phage gp36-like protein
VAYIVDQDVISRVGTARAVQLSAESGTTPDAAIIAGARSLAEGEVDSILAKRFAVPIDVSSDTVRATAMYTYALTMAVYQLYLRRPPVPEDIRRARDQVVELLKMVAEGKAEIPGATTPASSTVNQPAAAWGSAEQNAATMRDVL